MLAGKIYIHCTAKESHSKDNMFVERIIVHEPDKSSGHRIQQVEIYYNFVGQVDKSAQTAKVRRMSAAELMGENVSQQQCI